MHLTSEMIQMLKLVTDKKGVVGQRKCKSDVVLNFEWLIYISNYTPEKLFVHASDEDRVALYRKISTVEFTLATRNWTK